MKTNIIKKWALALMSVVVLSSCVDTDINRDPNKSSELDPNFQIANIQQSFSSWQDAYWRYFIFPGGFMNQWSNDYSVVSYGGIGKVEDSYSSKLWDELYPTIIVNVVDVIERTRGDGEFVNANAAARVLKAQNFMRLTDYYGDVPYFDAGKAYYGGSFTPAYDTQEAIYTDILKELREAAEQFDSSKPALKGDLYFGGDLGKWKKFANSLRLRAALRLMKVKPEIASSEAIAAVASGVMTSNADICYVKHADVISDDRSAGNGVSNLLFKGVTAGTFRFTKELIGTMEKNKDPRILFYAGSFLKDGKNMDRIDITKQVKAHYGTYEAMCIKSQTFSYSTENNAIESNLNVILANGDTIKVEKLYQMMQPSRLISAADAPFIHMSYAEVEFLMADAILRGINVGGTAQDHYEKGLRASVQQWTLFGAVVDPVAINNFVTANPLSAGKDAALREINTQLWVLHFLDPLETWANVRRTGEPYAQTKFYVLDATQNQTKGETPRRMPYPSSEQTNNYKGYKVAVDRIDGEVFGGTKDNWLNRVWWDKK